MLGAKCWLKVQPALRNCLRLKAVFDTLNYLNLGFPGIQELENLFDSYQ